MWTFYIYSLLRFFKFPYNFCRDFRRTCNPRDNYMHFTWYVLRQGDPPHFLWGKICSALLFHKLSVIAHDVQFLDCNDVFLNTLMSDICHYPLIYHQMTLKNETLWFFIDVIPLRNLSTLWKSRFWWSCNSLVSWFSNNPHLTFFQLSSNMTWTHSFIV